MGTISRTKTWNSSETLTASDLNSEFNGILNGVNSNSLDNANLSTTATYEFNGVIVGASSLVTTSAAYNLQALGTGAADSGEVIGRFSANASGPVLSFLKSRNGTIGSNTIVVDNDILGTIEFMGADGSSLDTPGATIVARVNGTPGANDLPTELVFSVTADGANSVTEALKIEQDRKATFSGAVTVGVDDTGYDVKLFGASAGAYMEWDESADQLRIMGASADATTSTGKLLLATSLTDINANDVLGKIDFQAPHEAGGTDATTIAASIQAVAQSTFAADSNATDLIFYTGHSEAAAEKIRFTSQGEIGIGGANYGSDGQVLTSAGAGAAVAWEAAPTGVSLSGTTNNTVATVTGANALIGEANLTFDGSALNVTGTITGSGILSVDDTTTSTSGTTGSIHTDGGLGVAGTLVAIGNTGIGAQSAGRKFHVNSSENNYVAVIESSISDGDPSILRLDFSAITKDNNGSLFLKCEDSTAVRCTISSDGDLANHDGTYGTLSDAKFKDMDTIIPMRSYWDDFKKLKYQKYKMLSDIEDYGVNAEYRCGLVAQEVKLIFPSCVVTTPNDPTDPSSDTYEWNKSSIIEGPIMARVVQELQERIELLENA